MHLIRLHLHFHFHSQTIQSPLITSNGSRAKIWMGLLNQTMHSLIGTMYQGVPLTVEGKFCPINTWHDLYL
jgi:hypothetical protein